MGCSLIQNKNTVISISFPQVFTEAVIQISEKKYLKVSSMLYIVLVSFVQFSGKDFIVHHAWKSNFIVQKVRQKSISSKVK